jgi:protoporphyrinogen oxidase
MAKHHYDFIILGGGLSGLATAALLEQTGQDYVILEAQDGWGGLARGQTEKNVALDFGIKSIPVGDISTNPLLKLKRKLNLSVAIETLLDPPMTFQKSGLVPFVGFGESKSKGVTEILEYYTLYPRLLVSKGWMTLVEELLNIIPEKKRKNLATVTKFNIADQKIKDIVINGEETWTASQFVSTLAPKTLVSLIPKEYIQAKTIQKLSRTESFVSLSLDLATSKRITELKNMFVLQDDEFYVVGQFVSNVDPLRQVQGFQISSWLTLLDEELAQDDENVSKALKQMKKMIKKAFPEIFAGEDSPTWERLLVTPEGLGQNFSFSHSIENLHVFGARLNSASTPSVPDEHHHRFISQSLWQAQAWVK